MLLLDVFKCWIFAKYVSVSWSLRLKLRNLQRACESAFWKSNLGHLWNMSFSGKANMNISAFVTIAYLRVSWSMLSLDLAMVEQKLSRNIWFSNTEHLERSRRSVYNAMHDISKLEEKSNARYYWNIFELSAHLVTVVILKEIKYFPVISMGTPHNHIQNLFLMYDHVCLFKTWEKYSKTLPVFFSWVRFLYHFSFFSDFSEIHMYSMLRQNFKCTLLL